MRQIFFLLLSVLLALPAYAHSGNTDKKGGHNDRQNGGYHYHHGKGPHDHPGGICELSESPAPERVVPRQYAYPQDESGNKGGNWSTLILVGGLGLVIGYLMRNGGRQ